MDPLRGATSTHDPAAFIVHARVSQQVEEIRRRDPEVRQGLADGIHQLRVALRRLRSALATYRPFLDREAGETIGRELKWLGTMLAAARDAEVQAARLGSLGEDIAVELARRHQRAHAQAVEAMDSARHGALLERLDQFSSDPPWTPAARSPIGDVLPQQVRKDWKRLVPRVEAARHSDDEAARAEHLHDVRKAAKRARYAAEPLVALYGSSQRRMVRQTKRIQLVLGEHQDTVAARALLQDLGAQLHATGSGATVLEAAHTREQERAAELEVEFFEIWDELT